MENNQYNIHLIREMDRLDMPFEKVRGVASSRYDQQEKVLSLTVEKKYEDDAAEVLQEVVGSIREAGGEVRTEKVSHPVLNMTCAACASSSQNILSFVPGVVTASVNYGNGKGVVEYLPEVATPQSMKSALQEIGYDMLIDEEEASAENLEQIQEANYKKLRRHTIWAVALAIPLIVIGMFFMHAPYANLAMLILSTPILFVFGQRFFVGA